MALAGIAVLWLAICLSYRTPRALGLDAPPEVFSAARARATMQDLLGSGVAHPVGSAANRELRDTIVQRLQALGYRTALQSGISCYEGVCGNPVNIIARRGRSEAIDDAVLLAAHYDSVAAGPGAADDGAAVASVLEIARILAARPEGRRPVFLLITDGEEPGLLGAALFAREHPLARYVRAAVNLEARGTSGLSLMFETGSDNFDLMRLYAAAIARPITNSLFYVVYKLLPNNTDFTIFKAAGYQGFNFAFIGDVARYHTPQDKVTNVDMSSVQHQGDNALAALTALTNAPAYESAPRESAFFDVFGRWLIVWRAGLTWVAAAFGLLLLVTEALVFWRRQIVTGRQMLYGAAAAGCTLLAGGALCAALLAAEIAIGKVPPLDASAWIAHPLPMRLAAIALAFAAAAILAGWFARRTGFWGFWFGSAFLGAALSMASAVLIPGASILVLPAMLCSVSAVLPCVLRVAKARQPAPWMLLCAALVPVWVMAATTVPTSMMLYDGLGALAWPLSTLLASLITMTLLPLLAAGDRSRRVLGAGAAAIAVAGVCLTVALPTYSADWPQRVNLEYWLDADNGQAHFLAECDGLKLPASLAAAAKFDAAPRPRFPGSGRQAFFAPAPTLDLQGPDLSVVSIDGSRVTLRLHTNRDAPEAFLIFPARAHIDHVVFLAAAGEVNVELIRRDDGATQLSLVSVPGAGIDFSLDAVPRWPLAVQTFDESYGFTGSSALAQARGRNATSSREGDLTVVHRTVSLDPTAGR